MLQHLTIKLGNQVNPAALIPKSEILMFNSTFHYRQKICCTQVLKGPKIFMSFGSAHPEDKTHLTHITKRSSIAGLKELFPELTETVLHDRRHIFVAIFNQRVQNFN